MNRISREDAEYYAANPEGTDWQQQEIDRLRHAITRAMEFLSNGDTEAGARVLRECFWHSPLAQEVPQK